MDTGDTVVHRPSGDIYTVACVHGHYLHTAGHPEKRLMVGDCTVTEICPEAQRVDAIKKMAASTATGHRPECARQRVAEIEAEAQTWCPDYGCVVDPAAMPAPATAEFSIHCGSYHVEVTEIKSVPEPKSGKVKFRRPTLESIRARYGARPPLVEGGSGL